MIRHTQKNILHINFLFFVVVVVVCFFALDCFLPLFLIFHIFIELQKFSVFLCWAAIVSSIADDGNVVLIL